MRSIVLSNGQLCVALDEHALVRDIYYPYVGLEDHVRGHYIHRIGVWVNGKISWFSEPGWRITVACEDSALASRVVAVNDELGVEIVSTDLIYNEEPVFVRRLSIKNISGESRVIKLYFAHQFEI
ncbi:MAG: glycoside hydrolase family 15 protein, partial [Candidatus Kaiserbacteria bacterium]|nr:glycoside hydrolase family 15 protein [Candidatus Kaiserbacteria bacterium]